MRTASMVLGIIGGIIAIIIALIAIGSGIFFYTTFPELMEITDDDELLPPDAADISEDTKIAGYVFIGIGSVIFIAGLLGIIGGALVKKKNILAGILMIIGSIITLFTIWAIISFILLLLGGIFAFINEKPIAEPQA